MTFESWQDGRQPGLPWKGCSPNLEALRRHLLEQWGGQSLGCYAVRPVRNGTRWSSHAFGAALDWGYGERHNGPGRLIMLRDVLPFLIGNALELGVQRIHDYEAKRYWQAGRGWVERPPGTGGDWLHIETTPAAWKDGRPITARLEAKPAPPKYPGRPIRQGSRGQSVKAIQAALGVTADGSFGPVTHQAVLAFQTARGLTADGIVGPRTWAAVFPG